MLFNSIEFLIFFPIVTMLYFLIPHRYRWFFLLVASIFFYMAFIPVYILVLFTTIIIDYCAGILIERAEGRKRKFYLIVSIISTCAVLFVFKYFDFFGTNFNALAHFLHWNYSIETLKMILPIGLSFHTFQSLSYVIEVYRQKQKAEHNFGMYSLYVMFFPQLVAGPIERPQNLLHQFYERHQFESSRVFGGLKLMLWGMFKKVVVADRLAFFVSAVYADPAHFTGPALILATVFFAFQIYADFSGYSDIAIGAAQVLGFNLMSNFNRPYASRSLREFWTRWHISLSTWFRDYIYIPLGGNRVSAVRLSVNLVVTFLISGLWHGANWTYVIWGGLNGIFLLISLFIERLLKNVYASVKFFQTPVYKMFQVFSTFVLVSITWIFFRAKDLPTAWYMVSNLFDGFIPTVDTILNGPWSATNPLLRSLLMSGTKIDFLIVIIALCFMEYIQWTERKSSLRNLFSGRTSLARYSLLTLLVLAILNFGFVYHESFIYFQF